MIRRIVSAVMLLVVCLLAVPTPARAAFDPFQINCGQGNYGDSAVCSTNAQSPSGPGSVLINIANLVALVAGALAVILIVYGAIKYVTANGDSSNIQSAKNTIMYSLIGLAVIIASAAIINFVIVKL